MSETASKTSVTIKKYANRRLYNTATSAYVTLEDLSQMVKEGMEFNVYDAKTSEDITRSVLTQIIVEEESKSGQQNLLPISFLRQLIGFYGDSLQWMVPKYLEQSMESLSTNQDRIREYFKGPIGNMFPFGTTLEEMSKQNMAMFEQTMNIFSPFSGNLGDAIFAGIMGEGTGKTATKTTTPATKTSCSTTATCSPKSCPTTSWKTNTCSTTKEKTAPACPVTAPTQKASTETKAEAKTEAKAPETRTETAPTASITTLKPENQNPKPATETKATPMPNVQKKTTYPSGESDDMQQKIANLQRQLADLAKSRA
jgi:polyhydroxyalkanoate synthesis repressor PhaR